MYLQRTGTLGGGGSSVSKIAKQLYHAKFVDLSLSRQKQVRLVQEGEWKWRNNHKSSVIYSINCLKNLSITIPRQETSEGHTAQCSFCLGLLRLRRFKAVIRKPIPPLSKAVYIPHIYLPGLPSVIALYAKSKKLGAVFDNPVSP
ncbi:hypothetical protein F5890DRAFT_1421721 [Lentinula detonsa]|uniref:Uncharacterized protein n=1 Tax=Lentinula detonsa TaxID=2804962 RepID=A0AA38PQ27_9AGAR|nr:hypothetical protein F5890DRAFT_1421721 [Lentinula detonsa]